MAAQSWSCSGDPGFEPLRRRRRRRTTDLRDHFRATAIRQVPFGLYLARARWKPVPLGESMLVFELRRWAAAFILLGLAGCGESQQKAAAPPPPTVTVAQPVKRSVVDYDEYVGRFL